MRENASPDLPEQNCHQFVINFMQDNLDNLDPQRPRPNEVAGDTQPILVKRDASVSIHPAGKAPQPAGDEPNHQYRKASSLWVWVSLVTLLLFLVIIFGGLTGYRLGNEDQAAAAHAQVEQALEEQYQLGLQDLAEGRFEIARQRFDYILSQDSGYRDAALKMAEAMSILYATATPTPTSPPPTITPSPTFDPSPIQDLFAKATRLLANNEWTQALDTLAALRQQELAYQAAQVDGMLYLAFRSRGIEKILQDGNLQGGVYDLSLAERFGPLDIEANSARTWARIYMIGTSFWEAYPQQAVYYFSQIAAAAPGLHDSSGWTALERYRGALIQYGDQLASQGDWCEAQQQYQLAINIRPDESLLQSYTQAQQSCSPPTATYTLTPTITLPYTLTVTLSPTSTGIILPSETPTPSATLPVDTPTPTPTETSAPPTETPTPTETPSPSP